MLGFIIGFIAGVVTYPWVAPYVLPLVDKVKGMFASKEEVAPVETKDETETK